MYYICGAYLPLQGHILLNFQNYFGVLAKPFGFAGCSSLGWLDTLDRAAKNYGRGVEEVCTSNKVLYSSIGIISVNDYLA